MAHVTPEEYKEMERKLLEEHPRAAMMLALGEAYVSDSHGIIQQSIDKHGGDNETGIKALAEANNLDVYGLATAVADVLQTTTHHRTGKDIREAYPDDEEFGAICRSLSFFILGLIATQGDRS